MNWSARLHYEQRQDAKWAKERSASCKKYFVEWHAKIISDCQIEWCGTDKS